MARFKVTVDRDQCIADQVCVAICPDVFETNPEDGKCQIVEKYRVEGKLGEGIVPENLKECIEEAAAACPVGIIKVEEVKE